MKIDNEMTLEILSKSNNEAFARVAVAAFASSLDPTIEEIADIKTAVSEAVTNCIIHGYEGNIRNNKNKLQNRRQKTNDRNIRHRKRNRKRRHSKRTIIHNKSRARKVRNGLYNHGKLYGRAKSRINTRTWNKSHNDKKYKRKLKRRKT